MRLKEYQKPPAAPVLTQAVFMAFKNPFEMFVALLKEHG
jgi:hypothetical protein